MPKNDPPRFTCPRCWRGAHELQASSYDPKPHCIGCYFKDVAKYGEARDVAN